MHVLNNGKIKDAFMAACAWNVWLEGSLYDVQLLYKHVSGRQNIVADLLFRLQNTLHLMQILSCMVTIPL